MTEPTEVLRRRQYNVYVLERDADDPEGSGVEVHHLVEVRAQDQLRGELEAGKQRLPNAQDAPINNVSVWVWCAMVRLGLYVGPYQEFRNRDLVDFQGVKKEDGEPAGDAVDPTAARSLYGSPSPEPSVAAPPGGSTPTSTSD